MSPPRTPRTQHLAAALCLLLLPAAAAAALYRWVDENGVTVYSQAPPANAEAQRLETKPQPAPAKAPKTGQPGPKAAGPDLEKQEADKKAAAQEAKEAQKAEAERKKNCAAARQNLDTLRNLGSRMVHYPDGTYERLSEDQVEARIERAKEQIDELCKPAPAPARPASAPSPTGK